MAKHHSQPPERKPGWPEGDDDVINKYGTYEVQATNGTERARGQSKDIQMTN